MKNILLISFLIFAANSFAVCTSPISRTNYSTLQVLTSNSLNTQLNAVYARANELPGNCITDSTITTGKIASGGVTSTNILDGTITDSDISGSAAIALSKIASGYAVVSDVKANNTPGGTFTQAIWVTRVLNTEVDPQNIVSLSSNQFSLEPGTYLIFGSAPAYDVAGHMAVVKNITTNTIAIYGGYQADPASSETRSSFSGIVTLSSSAAFEVQHKCSLTQADNGLGTGPSVLFDSALTGVFTIVNIIKIK